MPKCECGCGRRIPKTRQDRAAARGRVALYHSDACAKRVKNRRRLERAHARGLCSQNCGRPADGVRVLSDGVEKKQKTCSICRASAIVEGAIARDRKAQAPKAPPTAPRA